MNQFRQAGNRFLGSSKSFQIRALFYVPNRIESIPRAYVACAGIFKQSTGTRNRVGIGLSYRPVGVLKSLKIRALVAWYDNPILARFLAPHRLYKKFQLPFLILFCVRQTEPEFLNFEIYSKESISPAYVAWRDSDNPNPTRFLAPKDCLKIPAQMSYRIHRPFLGIDSWAP
jgi:hypothetical protein